MAMPQNADGLICTREFVTPRHRPGGDGLDGMERLLAVEAIRLTKARYCHAIDDQDWAELRSLFTDDCEIDWPLPGMEIGTIDQFMTFLSTATLPTIQSRHHTFNLIVEFVSPTEALARWHHENWAWFTDGSAPNMRQWGEYREKYRKTGKGWLISYFSEPRLFNTEAPDRRAAGIGDPGCSN